MRRAIQALLIISATGCGITNLNTADLSFQGTVTAEATGQPVAGAQVALGDPLILYAARATATTDAQGHYTLSWSTDNCVAGALGMTLSASATGFVSESVQPACVSTVQHADFSLAAAP
jgi:hypothetical protein